MQKAKYLILDFGNVLAGTPQGHWFITPNFFNIIDRNKFDVFKFNNAIINNSKLISEKMITEQDEYEVFKKVYSNIFNEMNYEGNISEISEKIASDFTYNDNIFKLFPDVKENLERLSKQYKLILLSDNWPCVFRIMKNWDIEKYFEKIYVSSIYNTKKEEILFFDYPIKDFSINENEAIFIDDNESLVDIGKEKGLIPIVMDRYNEYQNCKYKKISSLNDLE